MLAKKEERDFVMSKLPMRITHVFQKRKAKKKLKNQGFIIKKKKKKKYCDLQASPSCTLM
jgi:hypothetical protein